MFEVFMKIVYFIFVLPIYIAQEGIAWCKKYMQKNHIKFDWIYILYGLIVILTIILLVLLANGYPL